MPINQSTLGPPIRIRTRIRTPLYTIHKQHQAQSNDKPHNKVLKQRTTRPRRINHASTSRPRDDQCTTQATGRKILTLIWDLAVRFSSASTRTCQCPYTSTYRAVDSSTIRGWSHVSASTHSRRALLSRYEADSVESTLDSMWRRRCHDLRNTVLGLLLLLRLVETGL